MKDFLARCDIPNWAVLAMWSMSMILSWLAEKLVKMAEKMPTPSGKEPGR